MTVLLSFFSVSDNDRFAFFGEFVSHCGFHSGLSPLNVIVVSITLQEESCLLFVDNESDLIEVN